MEAWRLAGDARTLAAQFDDQLRQRWPLAEVGFCVTAAGKILSPLPNARPQAQMFRLDNSGFLGNREPVEVYLTANNFNGYANGGSALANSSWNAMRNQASQPSFAINGSYANAATAAPPNQRQAPTPAGELAKAANSRSSQAFALEDLEAVPRRSLGSGAAKGFGGGGPEGFNFNARNAAEIADATMPAPRQNQVLAAAKDSSAPPPADWPNQ